MKILVIGSHGQLGKDMVRILSEAGHAVKTIDVPEIDLANQPQVEAVIETAAADVIVNCAAYTAVDLCETRRDLAFAINSAGVEYIARGALKSGARVIHFSTDYVFDGLASAPYRETDEPNPQSVYGISKYEGDRRLASVLADHAILRIAWLYGVHGNHFIKKIKTRALQLQGTAQPLRVVTDEIGSPTYTVDVCKQTLKLLSTDARGVFHCTNEGFCSRFEFAREIVKAYGIDVEVTPCTSKEFVLPAPRPAYSVLENERLKKMGLNLMRDWKVAFADYIEEEKGVI